MEFQKIKKEKKFQIMKNINHGLEKNFLEKLEYELDNKEKYEIYRDFNKKNPKIFNENMRRYFKRI